MSGVDGFGFGSPASILVLFILLIIIGGALLFF
ncbi:YjcZ family sporulation protein [Paenibacillus sp. RC67]|nr:YjcZ family sporulation protein [Paenibacillus sp. RC67]